jgi:hypothetical protein
LAFTLKDNLTFSGTGTQSSVHLNTLTNGDAAFIGIAVNQGIINAISSVGDSSSNVYQRAGSYTNGSNQEIELWYKINGTLNNGTTWTVTPANSGYIWSASVYIFSGLGTAGVFDKKAGSFGTGTTNVDSTSTATTLNASELIIGLGGGPHNRPWSAGSGFSSINQAANGSNASVFSEYKSVAGTGAYNATASIDISNAWVFGAFTFTDAALPASIPNKVIQLRQAVNRANTY